MYSMMWRAVYARPYAAAGLGAAAGVEGGSGAAGGVWTSAVRFLAHHVLKLPRANPC
jgi:hypothetical protein